MTQPHESNIFEAPGKSVTIKSFQPISQNLGVYANSGWCAGFLTKDRNVIHELVHSEQFLAIQMLSFFSKKSLSIYKFNSGDKPVDLAITYEDTEKKTPKGKAIKFAKRVGRTRLIFANPEIKNFSKSQPDIQDFIHQIESVWGLDLSAFYEVENSPDFMGQAIAVVGSNVWMESPVMLSLFCLLLRIGEIHTAGEHFTKTIDRVVSGDLTPHRESDSEILKRALPKFQEMLGKGYRPFFYIDPVKNFNQNAPDCICDDFLAFSEDQGTIKHWNRTALKDTPLLADRQKLKESGAGEVDLVKALMAKA